MEAVSALMTRHLLNLTLKGEVDRVAVGRGSASAFKEMTPTRRAMLADLPLSGGGKDPQP